MRKTFLILIAILLFPVYAGAAEMDDFLQFLRKKYPATIIKSVNKSEIDGLYEVQVGDNVGYTDSEGRYFLFGHMFDMDTQRDLTAQRVRGSRKVEFPSRQIGNAIKITKGNGSRTLAVFSDPDCGYCRQLESQLDLLDNVTIYLFLYPLETLHPAAKTKSIAIWCSQDRAAAWKRAITTGAVARLASCPNPINENLALGSSLGVSGTPTMISADGRVLPGSATAARIEQWLQQSLPTAPAGK